MKLPREKFYTDFSRLTSLRDALRGKFFLLGHRRGIAETTPLVAFEGKCEEISTFRRDHPSARERKIRQTSLSERKSF